MILGVSLATWHDMTLGVRQSIRHDTALGVRVYMTWHNTRCQPIYMTGNDTRCQTVYRTCHDTRCQPVYMTWHFVLTLSADNADLVSRQTVRLVSRRRSSSNSSWTLWFVFADVSMNPDFHDLASATPSSVLTSRNDSSHLLPTSIMGTLSISALIAHNSV